jgi:DNA-binding response OmpR family regulator
MTTSTSTTTRRVLLFETQIAKANVIEKRLRAAGCDVATVENEQKGVRQAREYHPHVIIVGATLPWTQVLLFLERLREENIAAPVMLYNPTANPGGHGVRDDELVRLVEAASPAPVAEQLAFRDIQIDLRRTVVRRGGRTVALPARQFQLLCYFASRPGATLSRHELLREVWGQRFRHTTRTVDMHVASLRRKLEANPSLPEHILTVKGIGYKFLGEAA